MPPTEWQPNQGHQSEKDVILREQQLVDIKHRLITRREKEERGSGQVRETGPDLKIRGAGKHAGAILSDDQSP